MSLSHPRLERRGRTWNGNGNAAPHALASPADSSDATTVVAESYPRRDYWLRRLLATADSVAIIIALVTASLASHKGATPIEALGWGLLVLPAWIFLFKAYGLYDRDMKRVSHTTVDDLPWLFHAILVGGLLLWVYFRELVPGGQLVLAEILCFGVLALIGVTAFRGVVRHAAVYVLTPERVLFIGEDEMTRLLVRKMRSHPEYGLAPIGAVIRRSEDRNNLEALPLLGDLRDLDSIVREEGVDRVVASHGLLDNLSQVALLRRCKELGVKVSFLPQVFDVLGPSVEVDDLEGVTVLGINPPTLPRSSRAIKRGLDVFGSLLILVLTAPLLLATAIGIKLDSRGPVLFRQERIGKNGRRFQLFKFRTMVADAENRAADLLHLSKDPNWLHLEKDPRVTRVGRFLRLSSLDELPQLFNVLRGDMSLVGPRPLVESEDQLIDGWGRSRLQLTPGVTGLWQVLGRTNIPFEEMVKLDYLYVTNWSLWSDIRLMMRTLPVVVKRQGAN